MTGVLVAVVGPSGAGKDTLIVAVRPLVADRPDILFVQRTVTRPDGGPEDHATLTPDAFLAAEAAGEFALTWRAHGLAYGLPREAADHVAGGGIAVANLSRAVLDEAERRFGRLAVVSVTAPDALLAGRIRARGREGADQGAARLARVAPAPVSRGRPVHRLMNDGTVAEGAARLREILEGVARAAAATGSR